MTAKNTWEYKEEFIAFPKEVDRFPQMVHTHTVRVECDDAASRADEDNQPMVFITSSFETEKDSTPQEEMEQQPSASFYPYEYERSYNAVYFGHGRDGLDRARRFALAMIEFVDKLEDESRQ